MNLEIVIEQKAVDEIAEAAKWYSEKSFIASKILKKKLRKPLNIYNLLLLNIEKH